MKILIILGSLRSGSFSRKVAEACTAALPEDHPFSIIDGRTLPLYDADLDRDEKPAAVQDLIEQLNEADALVFVTPEYNYGIPGPLKNLIDWASRPAFDSPIKGKPSLVIAQSISPAGGSRVHAQLTEVLDGTLTPTFVTPSFTISSIHEKFDTSGELTDEMTRIRLGATLPAFLAWATSQGAV